MWFSVNGTPNWRKKFQLIENSSGAGVSKTRVWGWGRGRVRGLSYYYYYYFCKECWFFFCLGLTLTLTQTLAPRFTDTRLVPCERSLTPYISKTLSSIFFVKFRKRHISSLKKRVPKRIFQSLYPVRNFPSIP